jgi:DNA replication and repair protein RecF
VQVNGAETSAVALGDWLAVGWLTPAMDGLFADGAGARRRYIDRLALALDPAHARHASRYEAALRERNRLLAARASPIRSGSPRSRRSWPRRVRRWPRVAATLERLSAAIAAVPEGPFARPLLGYVPGGPLAAEALAAELARHRSRDRAAQRTLTGPHRDELEVTSPRPARPRRAARPASRRRC